MKSFGRKNKEEEESKGELETQTKEKEEDKIIETEAPKVPAEEDSFSPRNSEERKEEKKNAERHEKFPGGTNNYIFKLISAFSDGVLTLYVDKAYTEIGMFFVIK